MVLVVVWRQARQGGASGGADKISSWALYPMEAAAQLLIFANVLGLFSAYAPAFYFTFLIVGLCQAAFLFLRLVDSLFSHENGE